MGSRLIFFCLTAPVTGVAGLTHRILKTLRKETQ
uniref:Uncharacterized protein n=1 Tax=Siphoviridae sp. ctTaQ5 TaxID=2827877 RepID=A0A8S5SQU6_9CAUD|nr:MAG TPA: hypothetical protein [Siphoviridae sp. ctTaQ5]DAX99306.1 MAG TPA: hypothetical protein [Caudoviricetes sp.]